MITKKGFIPIFRDLISTSWSFV